MFLSMQRLFCIATLTPRAETSEADDDAIPAYDKPVPHTGNSF